MVLSRAHGQPWAIDKRPREVANGAITGSGSVPTTRASWGGGRVNLFLCRRRWRRERGLRQVGLHPQW